MSDLLKRPRFSWDLRSVPWTDGKGNQEDYVNAVTSWKSFHDKLPDTNSNKILENLRGMMLQSHLYGRAKDLCRHIPFSEIESKNGVDLIGEALYKKDALSIVSNTYHDFHMLLSTNRGNGEGFQNFESRFAVAVAKMKSHRPVLYKSQLQHSYYLLTAMMTLINESPYSLMQLPSNQLLPKLSRSRRLRKQLPLKMRRNRRLMKQLLSQIR